MSRFASLTDLALHVDELLARPGNRDAARPLVQSYLARPVSGDADALPIPADPGEIDSNPLPNYSLAVPTREQAAAALAALHDVHCPGAEKVMPLPAELPGAAAEDAERALRRAVRWRATLERVRALRDNPDTLAWFAVQLRRFERDLSQKGAPELATQPPAVPARHSIDFRSVHWYGADYTYTEAQAAVVAILWQGWENGTPDVGHRTLLSLAKADSDDLHDLFKVKGRAHPAWGTMIRSGVGSRGSARLCPPDGPPADALRENPAKTPPRTPGGENRVEA